MSEKQYVRVEEIFTGCHVTDFIRLNSRLKLHIWAFFPVWLSLFICERSWFALSQWAASPTTKYLEWAHSFVNAHSLRSTKTTTTTTYVLVTTCCLLADAQAFYCFKRKMHWLVHITVVDMKYVSHHCFLDSVLYCAFKTIQVLFPGSWGSHHGL